MEWAVGILLHEPGDLLERILSAAPRSELSTTSIGPYPTVSDDGYVKFRLEVIERPSWGAIGGQFSLTICCGGQGESTTKETSQNTARVSQPERSF